MASWDDDDYDVPTTTTTSIPITKGKWEGEDEDEEEIPDEWDAESEDENPKPAAVAPPPKPKKSVKQAIAEREERERKAAAEKAKRREQGLDLSDVDEDPRERKERERAAELAADLETAQELFASTKVKSTNGESDISTFRPRTKEEFDEFSKRLTTIVTSVSGLPHYAMFVAGFVKAIAEPLGSEDVKKVTSGLTALGNEKLKAEKATGGKGKKGKKPTLVVGAAKSAAPKFDTRDYGGDDDFDDFMVHTSPSWC